MKLPNLSDPDYLDGERRFEKWWEDSFVPGVVLVIASPWFLIIGPYMLVRYYIIQRFFSERKSSLPH